MGIAEKLRKFFDARTLGQLAPQLDKTFATLQLSKKPAVGRSFLKENNSTRKKKPIRGTTQSVFFFLPHKMFSVSISAAEKKALSAEEERRNFFCEYPTEKYKFLKKRVEGRAVWKFFSRIREKNS